MLAKLGCCPFDMSPIGSWNCVQADVNILDMMAQLYFHSISQKLQRKIFGASFPTLTVRPTVHQVCCSPIIYERSLFLIQNNEAFRQWRPYCWFERLWVVGSVTMFTHRPCWCVYSHCQALQHSLYDILHLQTILAYYFKTPVNFHRVKITACRTL